MKRSDELFQDAWSRVTSAARPFTEGAFKAYLFHSQGSAESAVPSIASPAPVSEPWWTKSVQHQPAALAAVEVPVE